MFIKRGPLVLIQNLFLNIFWSSGTHFVNFSSKLEIMLDCPFKLRNNLSPVGKVGKKSLEKFYFLGSTHLLHQTGCG